MGACAADSDGILHCQQQSYKRTVPQVFTEREHAIIQRHITSQFGYTRW